MMQNQGELVQGSLRVFDGLGGDHVGSWQVSGVLQAAVLELASDLRRPA